jgi:hypothetical protein
MGKIVSGYKQEYGGDYQQNLRQQKTVETHKAVTVGAGATVYSEWIDMQGYDSLALTVLNSGATANTGTLEWSEDGQNKFIGVAVLANATSQERVGTSPNYLRYVRVALLNGHTAPVTMSSKIRLKA